MTSFTRAQIVVDQPKGVVFDAVLETCNDIKAKIKESDTSSYKIQAKASMSASH